MTKPFSTSLSLLLPVKQFFHLAQYAKKQHQTEYNITYADLFIKVHFLYAHGQ